MEIREASRKLEEFAALVLRAARASENAAKSGSKAAVERATNLSREKVALGNRIVAAMTERHETWRNADVKLRSTAESQAISVPSRTGIEENELSSRTEKLTA